jgi:hypothetical protein
MEKNMKPWEENYESAPKAPWEEDYGSAEPTEEVLPEFVEEMHPAVSWKDRAVVKNFGTPEGSLKYLKEKYPNLEVKQHGDRILFKGSNEDKYKVLDPDAEGIDFGMENIYDLIDVGTDVAQGIGEGAATVGGALAAGAGTAGVGALAGGMAAGGAAGAGLETLKQKIAKELGVRDEYSGSDIVTSGAFGAASPLLFGTGAGLKAGAKAGLKGAAATLSEKGTFGVAGSAASDVIAPNLAEFTTGIKANVWKKYKDNPDAISQMDNKSFADIGVETFDQLDSSVKKLKKEVGAEFNALEEAGHSIDLSDVQQGLKDSYEELATSGDTYDQDLAKKVKQMYDDTFTSYGKDIDATAIPFSEAQKIKKRLAQNARYDKNLTGMDSRVGGLTRDTAGIADNMYGLVNDKWDESLEGFAELRAKYADVLSMEDTIGSYKSGKGVGRKFKEKAVKAMMGLDSASPAAIAKSEELLEVAKRLGIDDIAERADLMSTYKALKDPSFLPVSGTATSTSRTMSNMSLGALTGAQPAVSAGVGMVGLGPSMMKRYMKAGSKGSDFVRSAREQVPMNQQMWKNMYMNVLQGNNEDQR